MSHQRSAGESNASGETALVNERELCYAANGFRETLVLMWLLLARCLIMLLSLALAAGNAHAAPRSTVAQPEPCSEEHTHHTGKTAPDQHGKGFACCCDCLVCSFASYIAPELSIAPVEQSVQVRYDASNASLSGRALGPEPDPPRPVALS
jgi:hypothetical protein